jgi:hypothetical protein
VTVFPLTDERSSKDEPNLLILLPFVFNATGTFDRQDQRRGEASGYNFPVDIAKALAAELANRRLFTTALYSEKDSSGDLVVRGALASTRNYHTVYSYGISIAAVPLWMAGVPVGSDKDEFAFRLQLQEPHSKTILWENTYSAERTGLFWFYTLGADMEWYAEMLKDLMPRVLSDMEQTIQRDRSRIVKLLEEAAAARAAATPPASPPSVSPPPIY